MSSMFMDKTEVETIMESTEAAPDFNEVSQVIADQISHLKHLRGLLKREERVLLEKLEETKGSINRIEYALSRGEQTEGTTDVTP